MDPGSNETCVSSAGGRVYKVAHASSVSSNPGNRTQDACTTLCRPINPVRFADTNVAHASPGTHGTSHDAQQKREYNAGQHAGCVRYFNFSRMIHFP